MTRFISKHHGLCLAAGCVLSTCALAQTAAPSSSVKALAPLLATPDSLHPAWQLQGLPRAKANIPTTRFEARQIDGVAGVQVTTAGSYGVLVHDWQAPAPSPLQWRWRLDAPLAGGRASPDILSKAGDDAALKVCVLFDHDLTRVPWSERVMLRVARQLSGHALPAATVCYVWDSSYPQGTQGANPYTRRVRFISLRGRTAPLSRWVAESRDVVQDFQNLFADELTGSPYPPAVRAVLVGADSDNTGSDSAGWVADLRWAAVPATSSVAP